MTTWNPGDGDYEEVSLGSDKPPRRPGRLLVGVAAASLVVGFLVGARSNIPSSRGLVDGASAQVGAGAVDLVAGPWDEPVFRVPVFNAGEEEIEATIVELRGWASRPRNATAATIAPGAWEAVRFSARPDCASPPADVDVHLRVATETTRHDRVVALPDRAEALVDYHAAVCALRVPVRPRHLLGSWLVEEVYGRWRSLGGRHRIRFDDDGKFVAAREAPRLPGSRGVLGRYRLDGSVLTTETEESYGDACLPGEKATWRATSFPDGRLHLAFLRGPDCPDQPGEVWIARRLRTHTP